MYRVVKHPLCQSHLPIGNAMLSCFPGVASGVTSVADAIHLECQTTAALATAFNREMFRRCTPNLRLLSPTRSGKRLRAETTPQTARPAHRR